MNLRFSRDATFLNTVANHPEVRPALGEGESFCDLGVLLALPGAFALESEYGGFVFTPTGDGCYEFHTQFLPEGRGRHAMEASFEGCRAMFEDYAAPALETYVPHGNVGARWLVRFAGFRETHRDNEQSYWRLTREDWQARTAHRKS